MTWKIDSAHAEINFTVRHMMISNVHGRFEEFSGTIDFDAENPANLSALIEIDAASINTREAKRDGHLRSADFLMVDQYPKITFRSTNVERVTGSHFKIHGDLTIRDVTKPVTLETEFHGVQKAPWGATSAGFSAHAVINREAWGLVWNQTLETGGILVGKDIKIEIEVELLQDVPAETAMA